MRTAAQAVDAARRYTTYKSQYCLNAVQTWLDAPWAGPSAIWAWTNAKGKHGPGTTPPAGAPVFFTGSKYGHICLSVGGGKVRSTDWPRAGRAGQTAPVGETTIANLARSWGRTYAGWADHLGGQRIPGLGGQPASTVHASPIPRPTRTPTPPEETVTMILARRADTGGFFLIGPTGIHQPDQDDVNALIRGGMTVHALAAHEIDKVAWMLKKVST